MTLKVDVVETVSSVTMEVSLPNITDSAECEETMRNAILATTAANTEVVVVCTLVTDGDRRKRSAELSEWAANVTLSVVETPEEAEVSGTLTNTEEENIEAISTILDAVSVELEGIGSEVKSVSPR